MARTLTGLNPQQEQRRQEIILDRVTNRYQRRIAREIARAIRAGARKQKAPQMILPEHRERMAQILNRLWRDAGVDMAEHIAGQEKRAEGFERKQDELDQIELTDVADRVMQTWINTTGAEEIRGITDTTLRDVRRIISKGIGEGLSEREIAKRLRAVAEVSGGSRAQTIARTESHAAANVTAQATAQAVGLQMVREWVASKGERTRQTHQDADGQRVGMDEPFIVGGVSLRYPGDQAAGAPRETINCLHPESVVWGASPSALTRRHFEGTMHTIVNARGDKVTVTPNHPILTRRGWVLASEVNETDSVVSGRLFDGLTFSEFDVQNVVPSVEQCFDSREVVRRVGVREVTVSMDFHGETPENDVDVVLEDGSLKNWFESLSPNPFRERLFSETNFRTGGELASRLTSEPFISRYRAFPGFVRRLCLIFPLIARHLGPFKFLRVAPAPNRNPGFFESLGDSTPGETQFERDSVNRGTPCVHFDDLGAKFVYSKVTSHGVFSYSGPVYNVSDSKGYYVANGIVTHNCRCAVAYVLAD